jgi:hypothetical protein
VHVIAAHEQVTMPWKNGAGVTREIVRVDDANGQIRWRVSMAEVVQDGPFSPFPGYHRMLMLLDGPGFALDCGEHGRRDLDQPGDVANFDGRWAVQAVDVRGRSLYFNVIVADDLTCYLGDVVESIEQPIPPRCHVAVVYAADGSWQVSAAGESATLDTGDAVVIDDPQLLAFGGNGWAIVACFGVPVLLERP